MLVIYIFEPIRKIVGSFKYKVASLFNTNTPNQTVYGRRRKLSKPKTHKQLEENKINSIRNPFILKKQQQQKIEDRIIKDSIIRDIRTIFEEEEKKGKKEIRKKLKIE